MTHVERLMQRIATVEAAVPHHLESMERDGVMPTPLFEILRDNDLLDLTVPAEYGGAELSVPDVLTVVERLAVIDGATGWAAAIAAGSGVSLAYLEPSTVREMMHGERAPFVAVNFAPTGVLRPQEDGFELRGTWDWCSFSDRADYLLLHGVLGEGGFTPASARASFVPARDVAFHGGWQVLGLRGTGSQRVTAENVRLTADRVVPFFAAPPRLNRPLYRYPVLASLTGVIGAVAIGIARHAVDSVVDRARTSGAAGRGSPLSKRASAHLAVAEAEAALRGARAYLLDSAATLWAIVARGDTPTLTDRATLRLACVEAVRTSVQIVDSLFDIAGAASVFNDNPLQRCLRDVRVLAQHYAVTTDRYHALGRVFAGDLHEDPFI